MLSPLQELVAAMIAGLPESEDFALAGGAALIVRGDVDRGTRDLDFFGLNAAAVDRLAPAAERALRRAGFQALLLGMAVTGLSRLPRLRRRLPLSLTRQLDPWLAITGRGTKVLLDKQGLAKRMTTPRVEVGPRLPRQGEYANTVHSCFGLILWESKQLVRHELWMALGTVDQQVKQCLLTMVEWHSLATNPQLNETWYGGRRVQQWADPR